MQTEEFITNLADTGAKKPLPHPLHIAGLWLAGIIAYFVISIEFLGFRPDIAVKLHQPLYWVELVAALATGIAAVFAASWLALPDVGQRSWVRFLPFLPMALLITVLGVGIVHYNAMLSLADCLRAGRYDCLMYIVLFSVLPAIVMFVTIEKAAPVRCCWAGSMAALAAASFGYIIPRLNDINDNPIHLVIWFFIPVMLITMIGMISGKFYFKRSVLWQ